MTTQERLKRTLATIRTARDEMEPLIESTADWTAQEIIREEFRNLRRAVIEFTSLQFGIEPQQNRSRENRA